MWKEILKIRPKINEVEEKKRTAAKLECLFSENKKTNYKSIAGRTKKAESEHKIPVSGKK